MVSLCDGVLTWSCGAQDKDSKELIKVGGVEGLATALETDLRNGLDPSATGKASIESHRDVFGPNTFAEVPAKSFFALVLENIKDPIILILIFAALVRQGLRNAGWRERETARSLATVIRF